MADRRGGGVFGDLLFYYFERFGYCRVIGITHFIITFCTPYLSGYQCFDPMLEDFFVSGGDLSEVDGILLGVGGQGVPEIFVVMKACDK